MLGSVEGGVGLEASDVRLQLSALISVKAHAAVLWNKADGVTGVDRVIAARWKPHRGEKKSVTKTNGENSFN